jgi:ATP synthase F1 gamma subunit
MRYKEDLEKEASTYEALKIITQTYEDVALSSIHRIRSEVLVTRDFLAGVEEVYTLAKASYLHNIVSLMRGKKKGKEFELVKKNGKTVVIFISANQGLLGNLVIESYKVFLKLIREIKCDKIVLGSIGRYLLEAEKPKVEFKTFEFDDYSVKEEFTKPVVDYISSYEKILVVSPTFESILRQVPKIDDISGGVDPGQAESNKNYFFEPSPEDVMQFFEDQIIGSLFKQKMLDSMLSRYAARLTMMDQASQEVQRLIIKNKGEILKVKRHESNKKMIMSFNGISLWGEDM